jgi:ribonuclease R
MVAANEAVATYLLRTDTPSLYRVHDVPAGEKLRELKELLNAYGYALEPTSPKRASRAFQKILAQWKGKPEAAVLDTAVLRSMKMAVYAPTNIGHFGLASLCYTHFTSPIRRYPDLIVHRMLTMRLLSSPTAERMAELRLNMPRWGKDLSDLERRAEKAEREAIKIKQAEFMEGKINEEFEGIITSVMPFGFFVELQEHFVEGLVKVTSLRDDYYIFNDKKRFLAGERLHREFHAGETIRVRVISVNRIAGQVEFKPILAPAATRTRQNQPRFNPRRRRR